MLTKGYYFGIKREYDDLSSAFEKILDSSPKFLIAGSFSFWLPTKLWYKFSQLACPKLILLPFKYNYENNTDLKFELKKINLLIKSNTAVLINSLNHSKFILTDKDCFIGSNNLSSGGIIHNIENSIIMSSSVIDYIDWSDEILNLIRNEFTNFSYLANAKAKESALAGLTIPIIKDRMTYEEVVNSKNQVQNIYNALISATDCYQHLESSFENLVKNTKKSIKLFNSPDILLTQYLLDSLEAQFCKGEEGSQINIKEYNLINTKLQDLLNSLNKLSKERDILLSFYKDTWMNHQLIYDELDSLKSDANLINLNKFRIHMNMRI